MHRLARVPDFLIVGSMKSGTTALFEDLASVNGIFLPKNKEPETLLRWNQIAVRMEYALLFLPARPGDLIGEASTAYTKAPDVSPELLASRLKRIGCLPKLVYMVRDPIGRIVSHHHHAVAEGDAPRDINRAVLMDHRFVDYSRYWWQLQPWVQYVGRERVRVVAFEDYVSDREATVRGLVEWLGGAWDSRSALNLGGDRIANAAAERTVAGPLVSRLVTDNWVYKTVAKPLLPDGLRRAVGGRLLGGAGPRPGMPSENLKNYIRTELAGDLAEMRRFVDVDSLWPTARL